MPPRFPWLLQLAGVLLTVSAQQYAPQYYQQAQYQQQYAPQSYQTQQFVQQQYQPQQQTPYQPQQQQYYQQPQQIVQQSQQSLAPQQLQYLQGDAAHTAARRFIAPTPSFQPQQTLQQQSFFTQYQQQQQQALAQFQSQQGFQGGQQVAQFQPPAQIRQQSLPSPQDQLLAQFVGNQPTMTLPPPPQAIPLPPHPQYLQPREKVFREQPTLSEQQPKRPSAQRNRQIGNKNGVPRGPIQPQASVPQMPPVRAPPPPEKFIPYQTDVFAPLDSKNNLPRPPLPEVVVSGGSSKADQASFEETSQVNRVEPSPPQLPTPKQKTSTSQRLQHKIVTTTAPTVPTTRASTRASSTHRPTSVLKQTTIGEGEAKDANEVFLQCCKERSVHEKCESRCNFDIMNKKVLTGMFLGTDRCPQSYGRDLMSCAAQSQDHTDCCIEQGVHETSAGKKCLGFCNMTPGNTFQADATMLPCWAVLNDIKQCFRKNIEKN